MDKGIRACTDKKLEERITLQEHGSIICKVIMIMLKHFPLFLLIVVVSNSINAVIPAVSIKIAKNIIDEITSHINGTSLIQFKRLLLLIVLEFTLFVLQKAITGFLEYFEGKFSRKRSQIFKEKWLEMCVKQPYANFENPETYNKMYLVKESIPRVTACMAYIINTITSVIRLISLSTVIFSFSPVLLIAIVIVNVVSIYINSKLYKKNLHFEYNQVDRKQHLDYIEEILTTYKYIKDVKLWNLGDYFLKKYRELSSSDFSKYELFHLQRRLYLSIASLVSKLSYYILYTYTLYTTYLGKSTLGDFMVFGRSYTLIADSISSLISGVVSMFHDNIYAKRYFDFINIWENPKIFSKKSKHSNKIEYDLDNINNIKKTGNIEKIEFKDVGYSFQNSNNDILKDFNLTVEKGTIISIIGENGSGKTTLIKVLTGLFAPTKGQILLNGIPISELDTNDYMKHMGVLLQDFNKYYFSCKENIILGNVDKISDEKVLEDTLNKAQITEWIDTLSQGINTPLSSVLYPGQAISSGEWEKIAVARLYFRDPDVIILDEPTTNIDNNYNAYLFNSLKEMSKKEGKIIIIISHNLEYAKIADRIIYIDKGRIKEDGTHNQLLKAKGLYFRLWENGKVVLEPD